MLRPPSPLTVPVPVPRRRPASPLALAGLALLGGATPGLASAQAAAPTQRLETVVVSATRTEAAALAVPAAITRIDGDALRAGRAQVNLSEGLGEVPGLLARDRQNYAQDVQISVRGFGARASFGIRGVRVYVDDIPATLPDGQGQVTHMELGSAGRVEVLRGPFSALYGNASGGVISLYTEEPARPPRVSTSVAVGSDGLRGELTLMRAARALAALEGAKKVTRKHLIAIAPSALRHRLRRDVLDETGSTVRITRAIAELFG